MNKIFTVSRIIFRHKLTHKLNHNPYSRSKLHVVVFLDYPPPRPPLHPKARPSSPASKAPQSHGRVRFTRDLATTHRVCPRRTTILGFASSARESKKKKMSHTSAVSCWDNVVRSVAVSRCWNGLKHRTVLRLRAGVDIYLKCNWLSCTVGSIENAHVERVNHKTKLFFSSQQKSGTRAWIWTRSSVNIHGVLANFSLWSLVQLLGKCHGMLSSQPLLHLLAQNIMHWSHHTNLVLLSFGLLVTVKRCASFPEQPVTQCFVTHSACFIAFVFFCSCKIICVTTYSVFSELGTQVYLLGVSELVRFTDLGGTMARKPNKVKKSIWDFICGCSSPRTRDWFQS
jgi:hypothetical protein